MERKTIGGFIAALRKANGMTQKNLAEKLNVSDKTVSRWERGDGDPDLTLIPVLAEIFGVTCDELLRGERRPPSQSAAPENDDEPTPKGEKQLQRLLSSSLAQYKNRTFIAMGISVVGLIAALIGNLAFYRAVLGALLGAIFFVASIVCQAVFLNHAFSSVADTEFGGDEIHRFKRDVIRLAQYSIGLTIACIGFTFPLIWVDAYVGLGPDNLLIFGSMGAAAFLAVYAVACYVLNASLLRKGVYALTEREAQIYWHNHKLKKRRMVTLFIVMAVTLVVQAVLNEMGQFFFAKGVRFTDYDSFVDYMEQDAPDDFNDYADIQAEAARREDVDNVTYFYDEDGNAIARWEFQKKVLQDSQGNVVCEYVHRNTAAVTVRYSEKDGSLLPITVITQDDYRKADAIVNMANLFFVVGYCVEGFITMLAYHRKRMKA